MGAIIRLSDNELDHVVGAKSGLGAVVQAVGDAVRDANANGTANLTGTCSLKTKSKMINRWDCY
jgi:hypothetical protein